MKTIGTSKQGGVIVEFTPRESEFITAIQQVIEGKRYSSFTINFGLETNAETFFSLLSDYIHLNFKANEMRDILKSFEEITLKESDLIRPNKG